MLDCGLRTAMTAAVCALLIHWGVVPVGKVSR